MSGSDATWGPPWTVLKMLRWSTEFFGERGGHSPRLDAELLLSHTLGLDRVKLYMQFDRPLLPEELDRYRALVKRRSAGEPVAYLTGSHGFWSLVLKTDRRALVPRPETEVLVEATLERLPEDADATLLDVGTGTGCIGLALLSERPGLRALMTDASADALSLARENVEALGFGQRAELFEGDLYAAVPPERFPVDLIVSNPPYIAEGSPDLEPAVAEHEPSRALLGGLDGLSVLRPLVSGAPDRLAPGGWLICEIGHDQAEGVTALFRDAGLQDVSLRKDYAGHARVVMGQRRS